MTFVLHWLYGAIVSWGGLAGLIAVIAGLLWFFTPAFLSTYKSQLLHIAIGAAVFAFASTYFFSRGYNSGYNVAIHAIAAQDQKALAAADKARGTVADCFNGGGSWNVETGSCDKP